MKKKEHYTVHQVHHDHKIYTYQIGSAKVLIKEPNGESALYDKNQVKGESRPGLLKRLFRAGRRNVKLTHNDVEKFIQCHY